MYIYSQWLFSEPSISYSNAITSILRSNILFSIIVLPAHPVQRTILISKKCCWCRHLARWYGLQHIDWCLNTSKMFNLPFWDFLRCLFHTSKIELGVFEASPWLTRGSTSKMWIYIRKNLKNEHLHSWGQTKPQNVRWICSPATRLEIPYIKLCRCVEILDIIHYESMSHIYIYNHIISKVFW